MMTTYAQRPYSSSRSNGHHPSLFGKYFGSIVFHTEARGSTAATLLGREELSSGSVETPSWINDNDFSGCSFGLDFNYSKYSEASYENEMRALLSPRMLSSVDCELTPPSTLGRTGPIPPPASDRAHHELDLLRLSRLPFSQQMKADLIFPRDPAEADSSSSDSGDEESTITDVEEKHAPKSVLSVALDGRQASLEGGGVPAAPETLTTSRQTHPRHRYPRDVHTSSHGPVYYIFDSSRDVLCERGTRSNENLGNQRYLRVRNGLKSDYRRALHARKAEVSARLVNTVYSWGGLFLKRDKRFPHLYVEVPFKEARAKASQALREKKASGRYTGDSSHIRKSESRTN